MKWNTTDYKGNPVTWYSDDVINKIIHECESRMCDKDSCEPECECLPRSILEILGEDE